MSVDRSSKATARQRRTFQQLAAGLGFGFSGGLQFDVNNGEVSIDLGTNPGLTVTVDGLEILLDTPSGLQLGAGGLAIDLGTNPGLDITSGLVIDLDSNPGLQLGAGGLAVLLTADPGLSTTGGLGMAIKEGRWTITAVQTGTYGAAFGELVRCDPSGAGFTVNLPAATGSGRGIAIKNTTGSTNTITIDGNASDTIDGSATLALSTALASAVLVDSAANAWLVV